MNEELQSTNEELETINDELRERTGELNQVNDFLEAIFMSLGLGVAVLDRDQRVQVWNHRAEDLWGLRADEAVDHHFLRSTSGCPSEQLAPALRAVLERRERRDAARAWRRSTAAAGRSTCTATMLAAARPAATATPSRGAIVLMEDGPRAAWRRRAARSCAPRQPPGRRSRAAAARRALLDASDGAPSAASRATRGTLRHSGRSGVGRARAEDQRVAIGLRAPAARDGSATWAAGRRRRQQPPTVRDDPRDLRRPATPHRLAGEQPRAVVATHELRSRGELGERGGDGRAAGADELGEQAVRQRQRHGDAVARHAPQRSARCQKSASSRRSTRVELRDRLRTPPCAARARTGDRAGSALTSGKRPSRLAKRAVEHGQPRRRRARSSGSRAAAAAAGPRSCHGRTMSPAPSSSVLTVSEIRTSRASTPSSRSSPTCSGWRRRVGRRPTGRAGSG